MGVLLAVAATPLAVAGLVSIGPAVVSDDQAAAAAAVAVFNERFTEAGWTSGGPITRSEPLEPGEGEFGDCLGGFEVYFDNTDLELAGATARAFSDQFFLMPSEPATSGSASPDSGNAGAVVLTVGDSATDPLDDFVTRLGAPDTARCVAEQPAYRSLSTDAAIVASTITTAAGLGVGDASARLDLRVASAAQGTELEFFATFAAARVDRSLVLVAIGGSGDAELAVDPVAELAAVVDALN